MRRKRIWNGASEEKTVRVSMIDTEEKFEDYPKDKLAERAAYFLLDGVPTFALNNEKGRYRLLASAFDFFAAKGAGITEVNARVYSFTDKDADIFTLLSPMP